MYIYIYAYMGPGDAERPATSHGFPVAGPIRL